MKAYLITTGTLFGLVAVTHLVRVVEEWPRVGSDPSFVLGMAALMLVGAAMSLWAWRLLRRSPR